MQGVPELFGSMVFNYKAMRERLPEDAYLALHGVIEGDASLELSLANVVASAMKDWAIEKGATHFTHWFQPMTGVTAEKHDSFISVGNDGDVIMEFSGKELVRGEPDASSLPSGGLRSTFEARGYTAWDPTSFAFIKDNTLCIPTAFCSYSGEALDKKTPLLRSMETINRQALRILRLFGDTTTVRVSPNAGPEQEYFLIDKEVYDKRPDIVYCGRTLIGAKPPKGQELGDHYFGTIKPRVAAFMKELDRKLWEMGVLAKTKHNETAPAQHEFAPIFTTANIATDHNQLAMETMKKVALDYGLVCLLHEKPFKGVNGSGKHNNWSLSTNDGKNLLEPGNTPHQNAQFLLFLTAVLKAADDYQDSLRVSVASAGNDHRLGAHEAPPAIISVFVGEELAEILDAIESDERYNGHEKELLEIGVSNLSKIPRDTTDRNRTSPLAFTGNKFEFRMPGANSSIAGVNTLLNTIVAESLRVFADRLEAADDFNAELQNLIKETIIKHKRIVFNGNNYSEEWVKEAERRGLLNLPTTPDARPTYALPKNIEMFTKHGIYRESELHSRYKLHMENYCKTINIEGLTFIRMIREGVLPAVIKFERRLLKNMKAKKEMALPSRLEKEIFDVIERAALRVQDGVKQLEDALSAAPLVDNIEKKAMLYRDEVLAKMEDIREDVDLLEVNMEKDLWPYPTYGEMLYSV